MPALSVPCVIPVKPGYQQVLALTHPHHTSSSVALWTWALLEEGRKTACVCVKFYLVTENDYIYSLIYIPALVQQTCGGHRCELSRLCTLWPGAFHLGSTPSQRSEYNPDKGRGRKGKRRGKLSKPVYIQIVVQTVYMWHLTYLAEFSKILLLC